MPHSVQQPPPAEQLLQVPAIAFCQLYCMLFPASNRSIVLSYYIEVVLGGSKVVSLVRR